MKKISCLLTILLTVVFVISCGSKESDSPKVVPSCPTSLNEFFTQKAVQDLGDVENLGKGIYLVNADKFSKITKSYDSYRISGTSSDSSYRYLTSDEILNEYSDKDKNVMFSKLKDSFKETINTGSRENLKVIITLRDNNGTCVCDGIKPSFDDSESVFNISDSEITVNDSAVTMEASRLLSIDKKDIYIK